MTTLTCGGLQSAETISAIAVAARQPPFVNLARTILENMRAAASPMPR
jgi:hypothetical protein